jgi:oligoendopeptidase F
MKQVLKTHLEAWEGKRVEYLIACYKEFCNTESFIENTIVLYLENSALEKPITWLLKHYYDNNNQLETKQIDLILSHANQLNHWESQLHILQLIPKFKISRKQAEMSIEFVTKALVSTKKFVRATAYEAYFEVTQVIPELKQEFKHQCELALNRESASVQVKIRRIC